MLRATLKSILGHKARLAMTALAVILGVALMAGTLVLTDTVGRTFDDLVADIYDGTDAVVRSTDSIESPFGETIRNPLPEEMVAEVAAIDGVAEAEGFVQGIARIKPLDGDPLGNPGMGAPSLGISWGHVDALNPFEIREGAPPSGPEEVAIDRGSADEGGIALGDTVTILAAGEPRDFKVTGIVGFGSIDSPGGSNVALFDLPVAQEVLGTGPVVNEISVVGDEGLTEEQVVERITPSLPEGTDAVTGAARTAEDQQSFRDALGFFNTFLLIFALIALLVGAFIIANTFGIIVAQRGRELALMRAIGASSRQVLVSVMGEAVVVGLVASLIGAVLGVGVAVLLKAMLAAFGVDIPASGVVLKPASMLTAVLTGLVITVAAAVGPAWRASRVPPLAAMREMSLDRSAASIVRILLGLVILLLGIVNLAVGLTTDENAGPAIGSGATLTILGVWTLGPVFARPMAKLIGWPIASARGITGTIARENAARNPRRTASTAAALMIGVGLVGFISIFAASAKGSINALVDESVSGDLIIAGSGFSFEGFSTELGASIAGIDGVAEVSPVRVAFAEEEDGTSIMLSAVDTASVMDVSDPGLSSGEIAGMGPGEIAVSDQLARSEDLQLGSEMTLKTQTGEHTFTVVGTYENQETMGDRFIDLSAFDPLVQTVLDTQVFVVFDETADFESTKAAVVAEAEPFANLEVQDMEEFKESFAAPMNQLLNLIYALLGLAVIIAVIGIANTLALSVHERTRELGLLRAVGMTRAQLRSAIRWESIVIAMLGTAQGLLIGVFFGWAMVQALNEEGITEFVVSVPTIFAIVLLAAAAGIIAAALPAHRAAKLQIMEAIAED